MILTPLKKDYSQSKSTKIANQFLCKLIGYFNGEIQRITLNTNNEFSFEKLIENQKTPTVLIVERQYYSEKNTKYPIVNKAELKKLLCLEFGDDEYIKYHIWDVSDGHTYVNVWHFNKEIPKATVLIPESLLIALFAENNQIIEVSKNPNLFVMQQSKAVHSTIKTTFIDSVQNFALSVGAPQKEIIINFETEQLPEYFISAVKKMPLRLLKSFILWPKITQKVDIIKNLFTPFFLILGCYLLLSSAYITYKLDALEMQASLSKDNISSALLQEQNLTKDSKRYYALRDFLSTQHNSSLLWDVMLVVFPKADFSNIRVVNNRYVLRGTTTKATDLLEILSSIKQVNDAKFDYPTRKARKLESFVISFTLINQTESKIVKNQLKGKINE